MAVTGRDERQKRTPLTSPPNPTAEVLLDFSLGAADDFIDRDRGRDTSCPVAPREPQPSLLTLRRQDAVFVRVIHRYYAARCDSSETYTRAVRLSPSPADLLPGLTAGVCEVSRFSRMKFIGVPGASTTPDRKPRLALTPLFVLPLAHL